MAPPLDRHIRKFNLCFQTTSFWATKIIHNEDGPNFESTFEIQSQIGSFFPMPDSNPQFLQICFMGNVEQQSHTRCTYNHKAQMDEIVDNLEMFSQNHNQLLQMFKTEKRQLLHYN